MPLSIEEQLKQSDEQAKEWVREAKEAKTLERLKALKRKFNRELSQGWKKEMPDFQQRDRWDLEKRGLVEALEIVEEKIFEIRALERKKDKVILILVAPLLAGVFGVVSTIFSRRLESNYEVAVSDTNFFFFLMIVAILGLVWGIYNRQVTEKTNLWLSKIQERQNKRSENRKK